MARKVNSILVSVVVGFVLVAFIGVIAAKKLGFFGTVKTPVLIERGEANLKEGKWEVAGQHFAEVARRTNQPIWLIKAGDAYNMLAYDEAEYLSTAQKFWQNAVSVDPTNKEALTRVLQSRLELVDRAAIKSGKRPQNKWLDDVRDAAKKLLAADPNNAEARAAIPIAMIQGMTAGTEVDSKTLETAVAQLTEARKLDPTNAEVVLYLNVAINEQAKQARRDARDADADALVKQADALVDAAVAANPKDASMHFRRAQVMLGRPFTQAVSRPADQMALQRQRIKDVRAELELARQNVEPTNVNFEEILMGAATYANRDNDAKSGEKILRDLIAASPTSLPAIQQLAEVLGSQPSRAAEAADLLRKLPEPSAKDKSGWSGLLLKGSQIDAKLKLVDVLLDLTGNQTGNPTSRASYLAEADKTLADAESQMRAGGGAAATDSSRFLMLRGKYQFLNNKSVEAAETFRRALNQSGVDDSATTMQLKYLLGITNARNGQLTARINF